MALKIIVHITGGSQRGEFYEFIQDKILIGRSRKADLVLNDSAVSVKHCQILLGEDSAEVEDLMSKNGTYVNEMPVERATIKTGDRIQVGRSELEIRLERVTAEIPLSSPLYSSVFIAGYSEGEREFLGQEMEKALLAEKSYLFSNGEEVLVEVIRWFEEKRKPGFLVLDLKMPIINGINTAISLRAYERAYGLKELLPVVFFLDPPDTEAFRKVLSFCSPSFYHPRQADRADFEHQANLLIRNLKRTLPR